MFIITPPPPPSLPPSPIPEKKINVKGWKSGPIAAQSEGDNTAAISANGKQANEIQGEQSRDNHGLTSVSASSVEQSSPVKRDPESTTDEVMEESGRHHQETGTVSPATVSAAESVEEQREDTQAEQREDGVTSAEDGVTSAVFGM